MNASAVEAFICIAEFCVKGSHAICSWRCEYINALVKVKGRSGLGANRYKGRRESSFPSVETLIGTKSGD